MKNHNKTLNNIKGLAIILVLIGHCIQYCNGNIYFDNQLYFDNIIFKLIYGFHMPLFMIISGYLFSFSIKKDTIEIIKSKFNSILIPLLSWSSLLFIIFVFYNNLKIDLNLLVTFIKFLSGSFWFLWALLFSIIIIMIGNKLFKDNILYYVIIFIVFLITPDTFNLNLYKFMCINFIVAYFMGDKIFNIEKKAYLVKFFVYTILYVILIYFWNNNTYIYTSGFSLVSNCGYDYNQFFTDLLRYISGILGSLAIINLFELLSKNRFMKFLEYTGKNSLGIYLISTCIFCIIQYNNFISLNQNYFLIFCMMILILLISTGIVILLKRKDFLCKIFLGSSGKL